MKLEQPEFMPTSRAEAQKLGWRELDAIIVTGDAYVDHPSMAAAILSRNLVAAGFRTGVIAQPRWRDTADFEKLGRPRLLFAVSSGAVDSMLNNYTAQKRRRSDDAYSPGGRGGRRPDRALTVYGHKLREAFGKTVPIVVGGVEASLRRFAHYDYWDDRVRRPILEDCQADLLVVGPGERAIVEIARRLDAGEKIVEIRNLPGTGYMCRADEVPPDAANILSFDECVKSAETLLRTELAIERLTATGKSVAQTCAGRVFVACRPAKAPTSAELDGYYAHPFTRLQHSSCGAEIPALRMIRFSINSHRGCPGGCAFCGISRHQGKAVSSRSDASVLREAREIARHREFRGTITDVGGPTANTFAAECRGAAAKCARPSCLYPSICRNFKCDGAAYLRLLGKILELPNVKNVFVGSGLRMDLALRQPGLIGDILLRHTSGNFKIAPEHGCERILSAMRKPGPATIAKFMQQFAAAKKNSRSAMRAVPYVIAALPGATPDDERQAANFLASCGLKTELVQQFTPLPGTIAGAMYHAGMDPDFKRIFVNRDPQARDRAKNILLGTESVRKPGAKKNRRR